MNDINIDNDKEVIDYLREISELAIAESEDISYGEYLLSTGARYGCDCGCGGDMLEDEDFEYERDERLYDRLWELPKEFQDEYYPHMYCVEDFDDEQMIYFANKLRESLKEIEVDE